MTVLGVEVHFDTIFTMVLEVGVNFYTLFANGFGGRGVNFYMLFTITFEVCGSILDGFCGGLREP